MLLMDPVSILEQRVEFLNGVVETASLCNWSEKECKDLHTYLLAEVVRIDNMMFDVYDETGDKDLALWVWEMEIEGLRHWLSLSLGIKIRFI